MKYILSDKYKYNCKKSKLMQGWIKFKIDVARNVLMNIKYKNLVSKSYRDTLFIGFSPWFSPEENSAVYRCDDIAQVSHSFLSVFLYYSINFLNKLVD